MKEKLFDDIMLLCPSVSYHVRQLHETDVNDKVYRLDNVIIPEDEARKLFCYNDGYKACCRVVSWDNIDELYLLTKDGEIDVTVK